jgi:hypothetical protein
MADATGNPTTNYNFKTIRGTDTAGYTSINSVITSIDTQLIDKTFVSNMVILYDGVAAPSGWTIDSTIGLPSAPSGYIWIKKN